MTEDLAVIAYADELAALADVRPYAMAPAMYEVGRAGGGPAAGPAGRGRGPAPAPGTAPPPVRPGMTTAK
ncbi:hypothetical protein [Streptomyces sp. M-16]|uniref:hypothetical protein n=1 Tax=Streptomyces sp. M-16 TaxID=3233040 RepID=UPI003F959642